MIAAAAVHTAVPDLPIQAQCEPPDDDVWFQRLADAGVLTVGMHLEAVTDPVPANYARKVLSVPLSRHFEAFASAVEVFGRAQVTTYILAGLGILGSYPGYVRTSCGHGRLSLCGALVPIGGTPP